MEAPEGAKMFYFVLSVKGFWLMCDSCLVMVSVLGGLA